MSDRRGSDRQRASCRGHRARQKGVFCHTRVGILWGFVSDRCAWASCQIEWASCQTAGASRQTDASCQTEGASHQKGHRDRRGGALCQPKGGLVTGRRSNLDLWGRRQTEESIVTDKGGCVGPKGASWEHCVRIDDMRPFRYLIGRTTLARAITN